MVCDIVSVVRGSVAGGRDAKREE